MRIADKLAVPAILIAGGMVYLAEQFNMPQLILQRKVRGQNG